MKVIELYNHLDKLIQERKREYEIIFVGVNKEFKYEDYEIKFIFVDSDKKVVLSSDQIED